MKQAVGDDELERTPQGQFTNVFNSRVQTLAWFPHLCGELFDGSGGNVDGGHVITVLQQQQGVPAVAATEVENSCSRG